MTNHDLKQHSEYGHGRDLHAYSTTDLNNVYCLPFGLLDAGQQDD